MAAEHGEETWQRFDELARQAPELATRLIVEAIRLHAEVMSRGLSLIEQQLIMARGTGNL